MSCASFVKEGRPVSMVSDVFRLVPKCSIWFRLVKAGVFESVDPCLYHLIMFPNHNNPLFWKKFSRNEDQSSFFDKSSCFESFVNEVLSDNNMF